MAHSRTRMFLAEPNGSADRQAEGFTAGGMALRSSTVQQAAISARPHARFALRMSEGEGEKDPYAVEVCPAAPRTIRAPVLDGPSAHGPAEPRWGARLTARRAQVEKPSFAKDAAENQWAKDLEAG
jgi:hypothetical protein